MKLIKVAGTTSLRLIIRVQDSSSSVGAGLTGLLFNTSNLVAYYYRNSASGSTSITLATMTLGTFTSGGFKEIDSTNMPGWYEFCPPDAALASGADSVGIVLRGATNMLDVAIEIQLSAVNLDDATAAGISRLDATVSSRLATASYIAPDNSTIASIQADTDNIQTRLPAALVSGRMDANVGAYQTVQAIVNGVWDEAIAGHLAAGSTGAKLNSAAAAGDPWSTSLPGSYTSTQAGAILSAINAKTAGISASAFSIVSPVATNGTITVIRGDDYKNADGRALSFTLSSAPSIVGATIALLVQTGVAATTSFSGVVTSATACYVELTSAQTLALNVGNMAYDLQATLSDGSIVTLVQGTLSVQADVR